MSISPINNLNSYVQSILKTALQGIGSSSKAAGNNLNSIDTSSLELPPDKPQLSPFAQVLSELQQLQQSDPARYRQVTQQIAANLQSAVQTAQAQGNTTAANQLNQLAADFNSASQTSQLPNIQDLAMALSGGRHHHHHFHQSTAGSNSSTGASQSQDQILAAFQANATENDALNPMSIIINTLAGSGIGTAKS